MIFGMLFFNCINCGFELIEVGDCVICYVWLIYIDFVYLCEEIVGILCGYGGCVSVGVIMGVVLWLIDVILMFVVCYLEMFVEIVEDISEVLLSEIDVGWFDFVICCMMISCML